MEAAIVRQFRKSEKIAFFLPSLSGGGAERVILNLVSGLAARGRNVDLVLARATGEYMEQVPAAIRVIDLGKDRTAASLPGLVTYLRRERPQALLSAIEHANVIAILARCIARGSTRLIISTHTNLLHASSHKRRMKVRVMSAFIRRCYPFADEIVAVSEGVAKDLSQFTGLPHERIRVIYNPVITQEMSDQASQPLSHPWFAPGQPPVVITAGRLSDQKDYPTLLRAFSLVIRKEPARLLILGEGDRRPAIEALIDQLGLREHVSLPGFAVNPYPYMSSAAALVLSSRAEGLPTILIEGLALGIPVVSSDCPSGPAEILKGGELGWLVPVGDAEAMAVAIREALRSPRKIANDVGRFRMEHVIEQYLHLFDSEARP